MNIDTKTYYAENGYYKEEHNKTQILLSGSLRKGSNRIIRYKNQVNGKGKFWPNYTITREGIIYEHFSPKYYSNYFGVSHIDYKIITVELENMGWLLQDDNEYYYNWINDSCNADSVYKRQFRGYLFWEKYTLKQINSTIKLCDYLCEKYNIRKDTYGHNVIESNAEKFYGIVTRANYSDEYTDLNPSFNWKKLIDKLNI
ncbi:MAG: N-acetylmuramoyl-L-alanine amidase [bacterium]